MKGGEIEIEIDVEAMMKMLKGLKPLIITDFKTPIYTKKPKTIPVNINPTYNCPFKTELEGTKWIVYTKDGQKTFSGLDVISTSIVPWLTGFDDNQDPVSRVLEPKEINQKMSQIELIFWDTDVLLDYDSNTNKVNVYGELCVNQETFLANGPGPGFRRRP